MKYPGPAKDLGRTGVCLGKTKQQTKGPMKIQSLLFASLAALATTTAMGQIDPPTRPPASNKQSAAEKQAAIDSPNLTKFDLDFPGGNPKGLVAAIQKATGKPLNAVVAEEHANIKLPPLKMSNVNVAQLFQALELTSMRTEAIITSTYYSGGVNGGPTHSYSSALISCGFRTAGAPSDDSIWYFRVEKPGGPPLVPAQSCRFYSLAPFLDRGLTVDDITTAIQTGWKMMGDKDTPTINFHKDTKLLIAVGEPGKLETIDAVLKALEPPPAELVIDPATGLPKSKPVSGKPKSEPAEKPAGRSSAPRTGE